MVFGTGKFGKCVNHYMQTIFWSSGVLGALLSEVRRAYMMIYISLLL